MKYKKILLTGGTGNLGSAILKSRIFQNILSPTHEELNISDKEEVSEFFKKNEIDAVIHCAAFTNLKEAEKNPLVAFETNVIGTSNLVGEILKIEKSQNKKIKFIHISTDGVYNRTEGNYSENSPTVPFDKYGWTKLGAESSVNSLPNFCIIRTSFFDPKKLNFQDSPIDAYSSRIPLKELVNAIKLLLESDFIGTLNVGQSRKSHYDVYKEFIPSLKPCKLEGIQNEVLHKLPKDSSMDVSLWEKIKHNNA
tara:strand:- start:55777 stop:56532 length:756 start_codon:yes stop_codon:yes gene_type:complete